ncbi:peptidoglycan DD-metalloendopeptidase family protein [Deinococcus sp. QL22]|uniref:peptidoglycan DD-metalloendopeptidase family protein n=1 Tax=Deinococcus sp. QL22 TaxID=2939437 RepID=UPI002016E934|nr:M23 family metallopeptidase [Deinococcus sp. QL22]UQN08471.1 M23 family metallopeptidase [Deinococcus sp. QL22]
MLIRTFAAVLMTTIAFAGAATLQVRPSDKLTELTNRPGITSRALLQLNPCLNPRLLQVGTVLRVPGSSGAAGSVVVKAGDTLSGIARQKGMTVTALLTVNPRVDPRRALQIGQKLNLPPVTVLIRRSASPVLRTQSTGIRVTAVMPVQGRLTTPYRTGHEGLDIAAPTGTLIRAARSGVVIESRFDGRTGWGWTIVIDHGGGLKTRYSHNSANLARVGAQVQMGDVIARVGSTGNSTGPHLDYRVIQNGQTINPMAWY